MAKKIPSEISKPQSLRVLVVEDSEDDVLLIIRELKKGGYDPVYERVETEKAISKALKEKQWDVILCDYKLPKFNVTSAIALLKETNIDIPLIIVSGTIGEETAIECMRLGAQDYIMKDNLSRLCSAIARELEEAEIRNKQKQVEEALRQSEEKYRTILENIEDGYYEVDLKGNFTFFNASMCRILGYPQEEIMGMNNRQFTEKENAKKAFQSFSNLYKTGEPVKASDIEIIRKNGTKGINEVSASLIRDAEGKPIGFRGIARDVTERKQAEESLRVSEEKYRLVVENAKEGIIIAQDVKLVFVNRAAVDMIGYSGEILLSKSFTDFIYPDDRNMIVDYHIRRLKGEEVPLAYSFRVISQDGTVKWVEFNTTVIQWKERPATLSFLNDITERKRAEQALRLSEEKYRLVVENAKEGIIIAQDLNLVFVNRAAINMIGYSGEILVKPFTDFIHPDDRNMVVDYHIRRLKGEEVPFAYSFRLISQDGTVKWVEFNTTVIQWEGRPATLSFLNDITERKQAEEKLRESEEKYRTIIENMQEFYFEDDLAGNLTFVNDALCRSLGYTRKELIGMNYKQYTEESNVKKLNELYGSLLKTGEPVASLDIEAVSKDGKKIIYDTSVSLIKNAQGKPVGFRGVARDVTERNQIEEVLRQSEEKYRTIIETMQDGYFETDLTGKFTFVNDAECKNLGYTREELIEMGPARYVGEKRMKELTNLFIEIYKTGIPVKAYSLELTKKDGTKSFNEISISLKRNLKGEPYGFRGISRDVTERKQAEEERKQSFERLRKALGATVHSISVIVEMKDPYTSGHQQRVSDLARSIATEMGLSTDQRDFIRTASAIHDIGKISIPSEILSKPTKLTDLEFNMIKTHAQSGYDILKDIEFPWPVADVVLQHHERMDGSGYPHGLKGDDILLEARILAIADVVEAISSHRPYRPAFGIEIALQEIEKNKGILYDNTVADACLRLFREKSYQFP